MRLFVTLTALLIALFITALVIGPADIGIWPSLNALLTGDEGPMSLVMREIRLPRALLAVMIGGSLGLAGAAMQGYLRNPLADPGLIGVSSSAALGAVLAIQTGLAASFAFGLPLTALAGALLGVFLVLALAWPTGVIPDADPCGNCNSALAGAYTSQVSNLSAKPLEANDWCLDKGHWGIVLDHVGSACPERA